MPPRDIDRQEWTRVDPATSGHPAIARVETKDNPAGMGGGESLEQRRILDRHAPEDHAGEPRVEVGLRRLDRADATTDLAGNPGGRGHPTDKVGLHGRACLGTIQIDDVEPFCTAREKSRDHRHGIASKHGLLGVVALKEPHAVAATQVDRRPEFHRRAPQKGRGVSRGR